MLSDDRTLGGYGVDLETFATLNQTFIYFYRLQMTKEVSDLDGLVKEIKNLREINRELQRWLKQTEDMIKFQQEENKKLKEENEILKEYKSMYEWLIIN